MKPTTTLTWHPVSVWYMKSITYLVPGTDWCLLYCAVSREPGPSIGRKNSTPEHPVSLRTTTRSRSDYVLVGVVKKDRTVSPQASCLLKTNKDTRTVAATLQLPCLCGSSLLHDTLSGFVSCNSMYDNLIETICLALHMYEPHHCYWGLYSYYDSIILL